MDEGKLWNFLRKVMAQGTDIHLDYDKGVYKGYEQYSARLDAAAAERARELAAMIDADQAAMRAEIDRLRLELGQLRLCVNCGRTKPASEPRHDTPAGCDGIACTFDLTPQEAADHWRGEAYALRADAERWRKVRGEFIPVGTLHDGTSLWMMPGSRPLPERGRTIDEAVDALK